jgi:hypothetical protein
MAKLWAYTLTGLGDCPAGEENSKRVYGCREVDSCEIASSHFHCLGVPLPYAIQAEAEFWKRTWMRFPDVTTTKSRKQKLITKVTSNSESNSCHYPKAQTISHL